MKKIIIVNNNMKVGGVQKSLCNLLCELVNRKEYDVTLALFSPVGEYMNKIPPGIKVIIIPSLFRYLGVSQGEMRGVDIFKRGFLAATCRIFSRSVAIRLMIWSQKKLPDKYDYAISFLHNGRDRVFFGGVQDFVLHCVNADKKITFLHDDYKKCGANHNINNKIMEKFDKIAACSDGCRAVFESEVPYLAHKSVTVRNCNNVEEIRGLAENDPKVYDSNYFNAVCAVRFSPRKGVDRAIEATASILKKGIPMKLHILGSGVMDSELRQMVVDRHLEENVIFYGEQGNPYRFIKNADLFVLTSFHEAAPMVIDEAYILGVPVLTTRTNSSDEMVTARECGWVCENDQEALNEALYQIVSNKEMLLNCKRKLSESVPDNSLAMKQFEELLKDK